MSNDDDDEVWLQLRFLFLEIGFNLNSGDFAWKFLFLKK